MLRNAKKLIPPNYSLFPDHVTDAIDLPIDHFAGLLLTPRPKLAG